MALSQPPMPLKGVVQKYPWGKYGRDSAVARLAGAYEEVDDSQPYAGMNDWQAHRPLSPSLFSSSHLLISHLLTCLDPISDPLAIGFSLLELWFGTHVSGPSQIGVPGLLFPTYEPLEGYLAKSVQGYKEGLPFLLKVLSIRAALSIQAHPDAELAKTLHAKFPTVYRDPNHKPELAIAITPMDAMCSFRTIPQIAHYLQIVPEFRAVVGEENAAEFLRLACTFKEPAQQPYDLPQELRASLQAIFHSLMTADCDIVKQQLDVLLARLSSVEDASGTKDDPLPAPPKDYNTSTGKEPASVENQNQPLAPVSAVADPVSSFEKASDPEYWKYLVGQIQTIAKAYPGDVGLFSVFLLNVLRLQPGEAIFLAQNEPHAYLFGDCVECMATSDNVVRAGLTPKFKDVDTLVHMLTYKAGLPKIYRGDALAGEAKQRCICYAPPVSEFMVEKFELSPGESVVVDNFTASIFLSTEGKGKVTINVSHAFEQGASYFAHPGSSFCVSNESEASLVFFKATQP